MAAPRSRIVSIARAAAQQTLADTPGATLGRVRQRTVRAVYAYASTRTQAMVEIVADEEFHAFQARRVERRVTR